MTNEGQTLQRELAASPEQGAVPDLPVAPALRAILGSLYRFLLSPEVIGVERIPRDGPCLLAFNHLSNLDPHLIFSLMPRPDAAGLVASEYRSRPFERWIVESCGGMWLRRGAGDRATLRRALGLLEAGWLVGLAPEGRRSPDGRLQRGRRGIGFLHLRSGAPVLPVAITGTRGAMQAIRAGVHPKVRVRFGEPFFPSKDPADDVRAQGRHVAQQVMHRLAKMLPDEQKGAYSPPSGKLTKGEDAAA